MTQNAYLKLVRQYASLCRRFNKSYAPQILQLEKARWDAMAIASTSQTQLEQYTAELHEMTDREYGKNDSQWADVRKLGVNR